MLLSLCFSIFIPAAMTAFSGHYVPQLSQLVYRNNKDVEKPILNFKGFMVRTLCDLFSSNELCDL